VKAIVEVSLTGAAFSLQEKSQRNQRRVQDTQRSALGVHAIKSKSGRATTAEKQAEDQLQREYYFTFLPGLGVAYPPDHPSRLCTLGKRRRKN
jgi:hypothetical protein